MAVIQRLDGLGHRLECRGKYLSVLLECADGRRSSGGFIKMPTGSRYPDCSCRLCCSAVEASMSSFELAIGGIKKREECWRAEQAPRIAGSVLFFLGSRWMELLS